MKRSARNLTTARRALLLASTSLVTGCTITQEVNPVNAAAASEICIIENPKVRAGFLPEVQRSLVENGYKYHMLPPTAAPGDCELVMMYTARWSWDFTIYMSYARLQVFRDGQPAGNAVYDATKGGGNMTKWIDAEPKINELVSQLLPTNRQ